MALEKKIVDTPALLGDPMKDKMSICRRYGCVSIVLSSFLTYAWYLAAESKHEIMGGIGEGLVSTFFAICAIAAILLLLLDYAGLLEKKVGGFLKFIQFILILKTLPSWLGAI